jgi:hypothetical protein
VNFVEYKMKDEDNIPAPLMDMTNYELLEHVVQRRQLSVLEVELLHRLEVYATMYGDYLEEPVH